MKHQVKRKSSLNYSEILEIVLDDIEEMIVVIDKDGLIVMLSKSYSDFLEIGVEYCLGRHITEVIENTRLHVVLETQKAEIESIQEIKGNLMVANRIPVFDESGKVVYVVGKVIFKDSKELYSLANKVSKLEQELNDYKNALNEELSADYYFNHIIGNSEISQKTKKLALKTSCTNSNVLIVGESGTGKELYAHAIHNASCRRKKSFIRINCAAIPSELLESELFGYEAGAFSGAGKNGKKGKFELAHEGSILLDEIGELPISMQAKLLRVLQEKEISRLGSEKTFKIDVRVIASSNKNLREAVKEGKFREDLYYRLNVVKVALPSLKERIEEVESIAREILDNLSKKMDIYVEKIEDDVIEIFKKYNWPGNIRELKNVIERAINLLDDEVRITKEHLPSRMIDDQKYKNVMKSDGTLPAIIRKVEKQVIKDMLVKTNYNKNKTSQLLGISRASLYNKIRDYRL